jgi:hypothetical protein
MEIDSKEEDINFNLSNDQSDQKRKRKSDASWKSNASKKRKRKFNSVQTCDHVLTLLLFSKSNESIKR